MNPHRMRATIEHALSRGWATFGIPISADPIIESNEGMIDPEPLIVATAVFVHDPRLLSDVSVWVTAHQSILIHSKLASCVKVLSSIGRRGLELALRTPELSALPQKIRESLGSKGPGSSPSTVRLGRFAPFDLVAQRARMICNRLLYGAQARADIISVLQLPERPTTGKDLARLLGVNPSTVSRILDDLRTCGQLDKRGRFMTAPFKAPGLSLSLLSIENLQNLLDAAAVTDPDLRRAMVSEIDVRDDGIGHQLMTQA